MAAGRSAAITQGSVAHYYYHSETRHEFLRLPLILHGFCILMDAVCEVTSIHHKSDSPQIIVLQNSY